MPNPRNYKGRGFASDNNSGVHPAILAAIDRANSGHVIAYGNDRYTRTAVGHFRRHFGARADVYFVFNGTGANILALKAMTESHHAIICAEKAHINVDECGGPEKFTGCKLLAVPTKNGKLDPQAIAPFLGGVKDQHHVQRRVISISQPTELGTVYTPDEIKELSRFAHGHRHPMLLHMDGARIANAAASLNVSLRKITTDVGVDIVSFGGTKNGMMFGEAVVVLNRKLAPNLKYIRKQGAQLPSKMRFVSAQFSALLADDLWIQNARHANRMAKLMEEILLKRRKPKSKFKITRNVQANAMFVRVPEKYVKRLLQKYFFYVWDEKTSELRFMTSFDTAEKDVNDFVDFFLRTVQ